MRTLISVLMLIALSGCSITAERYKVPTMSAWTGGNPERVAAYQCPDGYYKARDSRGVLWCDSNDERLDAYPLDQEVPQCDGVEIVDSHRPTECVTQEAAAAVIFEALGDPEESYNYDE